MLADDELIKLAEDIRANGLRHACTLVENEEGEAVLIDGRNRLDALELIGEEINLNNYKMFDRWPVDSFNVTERVISLNIRRRHLTAEDRRDLIAKLLKETPEKSDRQIAEVVKASPTTVGTVRAKLEAAGDVSKLDTRTDTVGRKQPSAKVLKLADPRKAIGPKADPKTEKSVTVDRRELERENAQLKRDNNQKLSWLATKNERIADLERTVAELLAGKTDDKPPVNHPDPSVQERIAEDADLSAVVCHVRRLAERYDAPAERVYLFARLRDELNFVERDKPARSAS